MLSGKTAIVTGSSRGIGRAIAEEFARQGADVTVNYHTNQEGAQAARDVIQDAGQEALVVQADISEPGDADRLVEETRAELGDIDVLVNNAGIFPRYSWEEMTLEQWNQVLGVNLGGLFNMSKRVIPAMSEGDGGAVVNVSSTWAIKGGTDNAAYTASKGGIVAVTRQMCHAVAGDGVRVNAISPGAVKTDLNADLRADCEYVAEVREAVPAGRFGEPEDVAAVATFLASDMAAYVHGENVVVDGGVSA